MRLKNIFLILAFILPTFAIGQSGHFNKKNAIKISPIEFGQAEFQVSYERYFGDRSSSLTISPSFILKENIRESKEGFQIEGQYRIYLTHLRSDDIDVFLGFHNVGLYTGLYARYLNYNEDYLFMWYENNTENSAEFRKELSATEGGALLGIQIDITKRILIDFFVGGGIRYTELTDSKDGVVDQNYYYGEYGVFDPEYKGVKPKLGLQIGILF